MLMPINALKVKYVISVPVSSLTEVAKNNDNDLKQVFCNSMDKHIVLHASHRKQRDWLCNSVFTFGENQPY